MAFAFAQLVLCRKSIHFAEAAADCPLSRSAMVATLQSQPSGSSLQRVMLRRACWPAECEVHGKRQSVKLAAMRRDGMPDVRGEDQHQARARKDSDVIAMTHGGQIGIEPRIVEHKYDGGLWRRCARMELSRIASDRW